MPRAHPGVSTNGDEPVTGAAALFQRTDGPAPVADGSDPRPACGSAGCPAAGFLGASEARPGGERPDCVVRGRAARVAAQRRRVVRHGGNLPQRSSPSWSPIGVVAASSSGADGTYDEDAVEIATLSKRFLDAGIEPRHLRGWRVAADREAGLFEQLIQPLLRQRNPEARAQAVAQLDELEQNGGRLRAAMMRSALRQHAH